MLSMTETQANEWQVAIRTIAWRETRAMLPLDLRFANLRDADLQDADLREADLQDANLRDADLREADLRNADLQDADLRGANLRGVSLRDANLLGANLRDANLRDADLRDCVMNWDSHELIGARIMQEAEDDYELLTLGGGIAMTNGNYCWRWWQDNTPANIRDKALGIMATWVRDGDAAPDILKQYASKVAPNDE